MTVQCALASFPKQAGGAGYKNNMNRFPIFSKKALSALGVMLLIGCASAPPVQEMSDARQAIAAVEVTEGNERASKLLEQARVLLHSAEAKFRRKAFNGAKVDAVEARRKALEALQELDADEREE